MALSIRLFGLCILALASTAQARTELPAAPLRFEVSLAAGILSKPTPGRLLVVLGRGGEPRLSIGRTGLDADPVFGTDGKAATSGLLGVIDATSVAFPIESLAKLPPGDYTAQAVLMLNRDLNLPNAPGNLYSAPKRLSLNPTSGGTVALELSKKIPEESMPADQGNLRYIKLPSKLLSDFHGRPMFLRAGLALPAGFDHEPERKYPLRVHIGGYGSRFTGIARFRSQDSAPAAPRMLILHLDGAGPYGDPYQVNSANNGPYGDAVTQELIPFVEKTYRGIGNGSSRFTDGHSTGGWVSLALQIHYPGFFNGCWSFAPDSVDFRSYELINIYEDENAYVNRYGFERPAMRQINGDTIYTVRHECQIENVLGRGDLWTTSGKDWCAWNATYGPRGEDGLPRPLWEPKTGKIDRSVVEHWKKHDLRHVLQSNWATLGPKLRGKLRIYVGDADDYFLNNAVRRMESFLKTANPPFEGRIVIGPAAGHGFHPLSDRQTMQEMVDAMR